MIQLQGVSKYYEGLQKTSALNDVSLHIRPGEFVSIIGPSGSGKSTLLNLIGMLDRASSGTIRIDGREISGMREAELTLLRRDKIGFIFQFFNLLPSLNCVENVGVPLHLRGLPQKNVRQKAIRLLDMVGLAHRMDHLPEELSGGERQRVAIARALSCDPPILLADEPTGNLDTTTGADILALIRELQVRLGSTVVMVTHDTNIANSSPRRIVLRDSRIIEDSRP